MRQSKEVKVLGQTDPIPGQNLALTSDTKITAGSIVPMNGCKKQELLSFQLLTDRS